MLYLIYLKLGFAEIITGTIGSAFVIVMFYSLCNEKRFKVFGKLGEVSIGIYLFTFTKNAVTSLLFLGRQRRGGIEKK